jgi:hypothetical protein
MVQCDHCEKTLANEEEKRTHTLINHPKAAKKKSEEYDTEVSSGFFDRDNYEKGEAFGYE